MRGLFVAWVGAAGLVIGCQTPSWQRGQCVVEPPAARCSPAAKDPCAEPPKQRCSPVRAPNGRKSPSRQSACGPQTRAPQTKSPKGNPPCAAVRRVPSCVPRPAARVCEPGDQASLSQSSRSECVAGDPCASQKSCADPCCGRLSPPRSTPKRPPFPAPPNAAHVHHPQRSGLVASRSETRVLALHWSQFRLPVPRFVSIPSDVLEQYAESPPAHHADVADSWADRFSVEADVAETESPPTSFAPASQHEAVPRAATRTGSWNGSPTSSVSASDSLATRAATRSVAISGNERTLLARDRNAAPPSSSTGHVRPSTVPPSAAAAFGHTVAPTSVVPSMPTAVTNPAPAMPATSTAAPAPIPAASSLVPDESGIELWPYSPAARATRSAW